MKEGDCAFVIGISTHASGIQILDLEPFGEGHSAEFFKNTKFEHPDPKTLTLLYVERLIRKEIYG